MSKKMQMAIHKDRAIQAHQQGIYYHMIGDTTNEQMCNRQALAEWNAYKQLKSRRRLTIVK